MTEPKEVKRKDHAGEFEGESMDSADDDRWLIEVKKIIEEDEEMEDDEA